MRLTKDQVRCVWESDRRKDRRQLAIAIAAFVFIFLLCMCFRYQAYSYSDKFVPLQYFKSIFQGIRFAIASLIDPVTYSHKQEMIDSIGQVYYGGAWNRLAITGMAAVAGAGLAMAGAIFQTIYKNPMASPNMLGATAGVRLGNILMITLYSTQALELVTRRYVYCYALTAACVLAVIMLGKLAGDRKGNPSVMKMLMAGSVISQGLNVFTTYYMYELTDEDLVLYEQMTMGTYTQIDWLSLAIFFGAMAIAIIPMLMLRYKFNGVAIDYAESKTSGINPGPIRMIGQICGVIMVTAAMIHCGDVGMIGMVIPYAVRNAVGANSKKVLVFSALFGGMLLMVCRLLTSFFLIADEEIPVGFIMSLFMTPAFMIILSKQRRGFEQ